MAEYYGQRASDGGFIASEATTISIAGRRWFGAPGLYSGEQVAGWTKVVGKVHAKGGRMFSQLWHTGRASHVDTTNGATPVAPSVVPFEAMVSTSCTRRRGNSVHRGRLSQSRRTSENRGLRRRRTSRRKWLSAGSIPAGRQQ
jgi:2,4-dienoyl-CoA reductase-like NADH-dependent reductase (Old Yellow Enzyme family)